MIRTSMLFALLLIASCSPSGSPDIEISNAWARATVGGQGSGAVYAVIRNKGATADRLTGASTDAAALAMFHQNLTEDGISRMRMVPELDVPAGGTVELRPGGTHIMLEGLRAPLVASDRFDLSLQFEKSGPTVVEVEVVAPDGRG